MALEIGALSDWDLKASLLIKKEKNVSTIGCHQLKTSRALRE